MIKKLLLTSLLGAISMASQAVTVETVIFNASKGVSDKQIVDASIDMKDTVKSWDGFISRELIKTADNKWLDIVHWESHDHAMAAQEKAMKSEVCLKFFALLENESMSMYHGDVKLTQ